MIRYLGFFCISAGILFDFFGSLGLVRFPDVYNRLQAATKCVTFGTIGLMFGIFLLSGFSQLGMKALLCVVFFLLTSPVGAHAIARGAYLSGIKLWKKSVVDKYGDDRGVSGIDKD